MAEPSLLLWIVLLVTPGLRAQPGPPLGTAQLQVSGARLTLYSDALTTDAEQTLNVGEAARVRTCYGGTGSCGSASPGETPGLKVVGDLTGPELPQAVTYETAPGGTFLLPGFQREGDYVLANIRLVETGTGRVAGSADPPLAVLHVRQILLASATVTRLTLADLQARGIALTQQNFQAFNFAVGFLFSGTTVTIELPVLYQGNGLGQILDRPVVRLDGLPPAVANAVRRWEPPNIIPFQLNATGPAAPHPGGAPDEAVDPDFPLYGAIVLPGNVSFLNQFFDAKVIVANGAPAGSAAELRNVTGALRLPSGEVLRLAATVPPVGAGQKVPVLKSNGQGVLGPGEQGAAGWTVEGLLPGTHVLRIELDGTLARPGRPDLSTGGVVQAAVEVVDARFHLAFNHPDTVRTGEPYSLYVTVTNLSRVAQNLVTLDLASENISGAHKADAAESFAKTIPTLEPGASETVEYRLVADVTGTCVATTFQATGGITGTIRLRAGVGEAGIPLSPAALVLPRFTNLLPKALVDADVRLLGLAWSLATAPAGAAPPGLPHVLKGDVERRAIDLGEAGQRLYLQDGLLESLEALALDQLGNRDDLPEYDALRRTLDRGAEGSTALAGIFRQEQQARNLAAADFLDHFAETMGYGRPFLAGVLVPDGLQPAPALEVRQGTGGGANVLALASDAAGRQRGVPYGEIYSILDAPGGSAGTPFVLVGRLDGSTRYDARLRAPGVASSGRLVLVVPTDDLSGFRKVDFGFVAMPAGAVWDVRAVRAAGDAPPAFTLTEAGTGLPVTGVPPPAVTDVALPPFRVIGAVQDPELDRYGLGVSYLFNRPPEKTSAETAASYSVRSTFHGPDTASPPVTFDKVATTSGAAAFWQPNSERVVNVRYASPISALNGIFDGLPVVRHEHLLDTNAIRDTHGTPLDPQVPPVIVDPNRTGGLVDGRVLRGDGSPASGSRVQLLRYRLVENPDTGLGSIVVDLVAESVTGADGAFYFDFIEEPPPPSRTIGSPPRSIRESVQPGFVLQAVVPAGSDPVLQPEEREQVATKVRLQNHLLHVNIALLGRGTVRGRLVYDDDGAPASGGTVSAASTLFLEQRTTVVAADGSFTFGGLPVGPITLSGRDASGNRVYQTVGLARPGDVVEATLRLPRTGPGKTGTVQASVLRLKTGPPPAPVPSPGATVAVYANGHFLEARTTDNLGNATFTEVPAGRVTVQAADFSVSRTPALTDVTLSPDAVASVTLTLADAAPRAVTGRVLFHDGPTNTDLPVAGAVAFITGPGVFAYTDASGTYRIEGVPVQAAGAPPYVLTAFDDVRGLQGQTSLPPVVDAGDGSPIRAADILLRSMSGGIDGVVLDPLGRPFGGADVNLDADLSTRSAGDGRFSFDDIAVGGRPVVAHVGDGLTPGRVGYFGTATATIVFGGHRPFVTIRMAGSGVVKVHTHTSASTGVLSPITYRPTVYMGSAIGLLGGNALQTSTDADGRLTLVLPVGRFQLTALNPLNGNKSFDRTIDYAGQVIDLDVLFDSASAVTGRVVGVDGVTPVPDADVSLMASGLLPQAQRTNGQGEFRYELVPQGPVSVTAAALVGSVDRVGRTDGIVSGPGQTLDLTVVMKAQGTVRGRVVELVGGVPVPLANAQFYLQESAYPNRRLPAGSGFFSANAVGEYEVSHVFAGPVTVVARDRDQVTRQGSARGEITADFQILTLPDLLITTSVGSLGVLVRDPDTGGPVPDAQVTLSNGDVTVADADGQASFEALPLGTYSVHAFHAPTGRAGLTSGVRLLTDGDHVETVVVLDSRGQVAGTLFDDPAKSTPVGGGTVQLSGRTNGRTWGTPISALASTSTEPSTLGRFLFDGIPPGSFDLAAGITGSPRRAAASVTTTPTAPVVSVDLVLEPVAERFVRLFEKLTAGTSEVDTATGVFTLTMFQPAGCDRGCPFAFTTSAPSVPSPGHLYRFPDVLTSQSLRVTVQESSGEQRTGSIAGTGAFAGDGSATDPYRLVLRPKGRVVVTVRDAGGQPAQANVTLDASGGHFESATDGAGQAAFDAILSGDVYAAARATSTGFGGTASGRLDFDDQALNLSIVLAPAVSAHGVVYHPPAGDVWDGDVGTLTPEAGAIVSIRDSGGQLQVVSTAVDGTYRFAVLRQGPYSVTASDATGEAFAGGTGTLAGPDGNDNALPPLVLDAMPPRIVSIVPPPGAVGISRNAPVEIVFTEPLHPDVLPSGGPTSPYFTLRSASGALAVGAWTASLDALGEQVVRFTPTVLYDNVTVYGLTIAGGPAGVRDRAGRPLTASGDVGSNFTTSDTIGPVVVGTVPPFDRPVDPFVPIRVDFSEAVTATAPELDGSGPTPAAELFWQQNGSPDWRPVPVTLFLSRGGYSLVVEPPTGVSYQNDSLKRRLHVSRLRDASGNAMADADLAFRVYDQNPPHLDVSFPAGAPDGNLVASSAYTLVPLLSNLDDLPTGDVDLVEYTLGSSADPSTPASAPAFVARAAPFSWNFVAAYLGNGVDPRPFPVWVKAVDTSTNASNVVRLAMQVLPNAPPSIGPVTPAAVAPVAGTFYAGSSITATVAGVSDPDGTQLTLAAELRKDNAGSPNDPADLVASLPSLPLVRPAGGWGALAPPVFDATIPIGIAEGTSLFFRVKATDPLGISAVAESPRFAVAHDPAPPVLDSFVARLPGGAPASRFFIGQKFVVEFRARDEETAVRTAGLTLSGIFGSPQAVTLVSGTTNLYRTAELTVPATVPAGGESVTATASATDWGANTSTATLDVALSPTPDPYAPVATWLTPWEGGAWPSAYASTVSAQGVALLLRVRATDLDQSGGGDVPGTIASVQFRGPADSAGTLASSVVDGALVAGTAAPGAGVWEALWNVPNGVAEGTLLSFEVRVVDTGANVTTATAHLRAVKARRVYEAAQPAVLPADTMLAAGGDPAGPVFLLDGTVLSLYPQAGGAVRSLGSLYAYAGGELAGAGVTPHASVLTAPEVTSYASSVLYNPLELTVTDTLGVGHGARIDVTAKGLLGSTTTQSMVLPGQTGSQQYAGGSHGGSGGPGSPLGWTRTDLYLPGSVFDSVQDPSLPGGGGGPASQSAAGGTGGGVVRLLAPGAVVHLAGNVLADGAEGPGGGVPGYPIGGGGAGGAIRIVAGRLEGTGRLSASGGRGTNPGYTGGGAGGRIALSFSEPAADALSLDVAAAGGLNSLPPDANAQQLGGAGTIHVEELDALGVPKAPGRLVVSNGSGKPAWPTPFSGPQRFGAVEGHGASRLVFADDVTVGATDPGVTNDRASLSLDAEARALLSADLPGIVMTASPDGGDVTTGQSLTLTFSASDPIGLSGLTTAFSPASPVTTAYADEPLSVTQGAAPLVLNVPAAQPPGPISYTLAATDRAGRTATVQKTWNVLPDAPPSLILSGLTPGASVLPGTTLTATATASDDVAVASVVFSLSGAVTATDSRAVNLPSTTQNFSHRLPTNLTAGQSVTLQVDAFDSFGHKTPAAPVTWTILADTVAPVIAPVALSPVRTGDVYSSGDVVTFTVTATDDVALATIRLTIDGRTTDFSASPAVLVWTAPDVGGTTPFSLYVEALDIAGNRSTTAKPLTVNPAVGATRIVVETAPDGHGVVVPAQDIVAGSSLKVFAVSRDAGNNFVSNVVPDGWSLVGITGGVVAGDLAPNAAGAIAEFATITYGSRPISIAAGPDGNLWFTEANANRVGRITPTGAITEFTIPTSGSNPFGIAAGPDGNLWFTENSGNKIGRITTTGVITEFPVPTAGSSPLDIAEGPDGNLWFTEYSGYKIGRITPVGVVTEFSIPTAVSRPYGITAGPDGNIWFAEEGGNRIGRITPAGVVTEFPIPTAFSQPRGIVAGPDDNLWFTEYAATKIGRITPAGVISEFPVPAGGNWLWDIAVGPDGNLWFTDAANNKIGRVTTAGVITEFPIPTASSNPRTLAAGPDGSLWFTEDNTNKIGRVATGVSATFTGRVAGSAAIRAAMAGMVSNDSGTLTVLPGSASKLAFGMQPSNSIAGSPISPAVTVRILDFGGNQIAGSASVTVAIGTNSGGGTLSGTLAVAAVAGVATFSDLSIDKAGAGYTLTAASTGLDGATSSSFDVAVGPPSKLAFGMPPTNTPAGLPITPAVSVKVLDAGGNQTTSTASVTVAMGTNPAGGTLSGTLTVVAVAGVATFGDLSIDRFGTGYTLTAASLGLTGATSGTFSITAAGATKILVETAADGSGTVVPAQNVAAGTSLTVYAISRDAGNNFVANVVPDSWSLAGITGGVVAEDLVANPPNAIAEFPIPTVGSHPIQIAAGPDGNLWFTEYTGQKIGRLTPAGLVTEFSTPTVNSFPRGIAAGPDGNLWFTESSANKIGRITTTGVITEFPVPTGGSSPYVITAGPDGNLWFTEFNANKIGRITTAGVITEFPVPTAGSSPYGIATGADGNLWFAEYNTNKIGRSTPIGVITEFTLPVPGSQPYGMAAGPDGSLWFTENNANKIGRITTAGVVTEFPVPTVASGTLSIAAGSDGSLWFTESGGNKIGRITPAGVVTEFAIPTASSQPDGIAAGPDGSLWFAEFATTKIGRITTGPSATFTGHLTGSAAIHAAQAGLTSTDSGTLTVVVGLASKLAFGTPPSNTTSGSPITPAVTVRILDAGGNQTTSTAPVTVAIGTNSGGGTLSGTLTVAAVSGVATFSNLSIDKVGVGYTLRAASAGLTGASSSSFDIAVGAASKLAFGTQPSNTPMGAPITPAVTVRILDAGGNQTTSPAPVTVAIGTNPGGGTLSGTTTVAAAAGVATFSDLAIDRFGTGYTLTAASSGLTGETSFAFRVTAGPATMIGVETAADGRGTVVPAQSIAAGSTLTVYAIIRDAEGNFAANVAPDSWSVVGITGGVAAGDLVANPANAITEFPIPTANSQPNSIVAGPDGNVWFAEYNGNKIGRITAAGAITEFPIPTAGSHPFDVSLAAGPDGNVWFTEYSANKIGRITPAGAITEFTIPGGISSPYGVAAGPDGNVWFTEYNGNKIGRITTAGVVTDFPIPTANSQPRGIAAGPDGNLWFTEYNANKIGRITTAGVVTEFPIPTAGSQPYGITAGPDGNLWFIEFYSGANKVGRITPAGAIAEFSIPTINSNSIGIAAGPDGNLWFTERYANKIGRITPAGVFTEFPIPTATSTSTGIAAGPDGNVWFVESFGNKVGRIATGPSATFTGHLPGSAAIHAAKAGLATTDSGTLTVVVGAASKVAFGTQPSSTTSGSPITPAVTVRILDPAGNLTSSTAPVTLGIGTNPAGGTLSGTTTVAAVAGVATFSDLAIDKAGTGYTFTAASPGLTGSTSSTFNVTAGSPLKLVFGTQPYNTPVGSPITPAVTVRILDAAGNQTTSTAPVTLAVGTNPAGGTLSGTTTVAAVGGVATFGNLSIDKGGTGYTLTAASPGLTGATSVTFKITAGPATKLLVETAPDGKGAVVPAQDVPAGSSLTVYAISRDANDNFAANVLPDTWSLVGITGGVVAGDLVVNGAGAITEVPIPSAGSQPNGVAAGPDGNVWFTEYTTNKVGRITPSGVVTEFSTASGNPLAIAAGPDGNLWFTESGGNKIGQITTSGSITTFPVLTAASYPSAIVTGPDGNVWFTEAIGSRIGRITTAGVVTEYPTLTASSNPIGIAAGPDGNLWFTEAAANKIGRITTSGTITEFVVPTGGSQPSGIAAGPDGNLWFAEWQANKIGRITPAGVITEFPIPTAGGQPYGIAAGRDGNLWFTESSGNKIGRITTAGVVTEFPIPTASSNPNAIVVGPDGALWFTEWSGNKIGRVATGGSATFTGHLAGSAAIHAAKAGLISTDSGTLTVTGSSSLGIRSMSLCSDGFGPLKPGSSFAVCADVAGGGTVEVGLEISGAFTESRSDYRSCLDPVTIPGSAAPGTAVATLTARDRSGRTAVSTLTFDVARDEQEPVLVSLEPATETTFASGDAVRIRVDAWDDVAVASVAFTVAGRTAVLAAPPWEVSLRAPPVSGETALPAAVEAFDPAGNSVRKTLDLRVVPAGTPRVPKAEASGPGITYGGGRLSVDGGWPWRDAAEHVEPLELSRIGSHAVLAADGAVVAVDGVVEPGAAAGGSVDVRRGGEWIGRFRIEGVSGDGLVLRLESGAAGEVRAGDSVEGHWVFESVELTRGASLVSKDIVEAATIRVDASSRLQSRNLVIPAGAEAPAECPTRGPRPDPPGTRPRAEGEAP